MNTLIAGAASGLLFASLSIAFGCFAIFVMYKNRIDPINQMFDTLAPSKIILASGRSTENLAPILIQVR